MAVGGAQPVMAASAAVIDPAMGAAALEEATTLPREAASTVSRAASRFWTIVSAHAAVDLYAAFVVSLAVALQARLSLTDMQLTLLFVINGVVSGFSQPVFAWLTDKLDTRLCAPVGLVISAAALCSIGFADSFGSLVALHVVGTIGVGMFHPIGAALTGQLGRGMAFGRSMAVTLFFVAGMVGSVIGPILVTRMNERLGMRSLLWLIPPALVFAFFIRRASSRVPHRHSLTTRAEPETREQTRARHGAIATLFIAAVLRFGVNNALFFLYALWCKERIAGDAARASSASGVLFAATSVGMGVSALLAGRMVRSGEEKGPMVWIPLAASPLILAMGFFPPESAWTYGGMIAMAFVAAGGFAAAAPLAISAAQRLMPGATGMASSLMMGGAWATSAAFPFLASWAISGGGLPAGFAVMAGLLAMNGVVSMLVPRALLRSSAHH